MTVFSATSCKAEIAPAPLQKAQLGNTLAESQGTLSAANDRKKKKKATEKRVYLII